VVPTLLGVMVVIFLVVHLIPGDPVQAMLGDRATPDQMVTTRHQLGLDRPLPLQFTAFMGRYLHGDMGASIRTREEVTTAIGARLPYTVELALAGVLLSILFGVPLGILAALRRGGLVDLLSLGLATAGIAAPVFFVGIMLSLLFAIRLRWFPSIGGGSPDDPLSIAQALVLPAVTLGFSGMALVARMTRSSMLDVLRAGLCSDGSREGVAASERDPEARTPQCGTADRHHHRPQLRLPPGRRDRRRDGLRPAGAGQAAAGRDPRS